MILLLSAAVIKTRQATSQTLQPADVSISTHNYKHPNKALLAKKIYKEGGYISAFSPNAEGRVTGYKYNAVMATTPKYTLDKTELVILKYSFQDKENHNPLLSPRNYKTSRQFDRRQKTPVADPRLCSAE